MKNQPKSMVLELIEDVAGATVALAEQQANEGDSNLAQKLQKELNKEGRPKRSAKAGKSNCKPWTWSCSTDLPAILITTVTTVRESEGRPEGIPPHYMFCQGHGVYGKGYWIDPTE